ncbi:MAG: DUF2066 domain-containing protein [Gammaproteobacteria bacterium]|jgi:hypothetical protein|nr:DUF2066 domain-containing protein [Gammaproteobacteria bacterium]
MLNSNGKIIIFVSLLFAFGQAPAGQAVSLYDVEVLVADESADTRWRVFNEGLDEVFVRISGDSIVMDKLKRPPASRYVKQYSYDPVEKPESNEDGQLLSHRIKIQYNGSAMEEYLRENGYPVWGEHRSEVVIWMAIRDGRNEYVLKDTDNSLLKASAQQAMHRRGVPDRWPLFDYKDRKILKVADIRGGFKDPVVKASKRYSRGPALTGSLIWNGSKWQSSWSLLMENGNRHWSIEDADYNVLINKAIDQTADAMGIVFAIHGVADNQNLARVQLDIQDVKSIDAYRKLENYLRDLSAVEMAKPLKVDGQSAIFEITLRSSEGDFLNLVKNDAELVEVKPVVKDAPPAGGLAPTMLPDTKPGVLAGVDAAAESTPESQSDKIKPIPVYYYKYLN